MQDKTINNALLALRKQAIRGDGDGLGHIEALLIQRGVDMPRVLPPKRLDASRKGLMTRLILDALKDGPRTMLEVTAHVNAARPEIDYDAAYKRTGMALAKIKRRGMRCSVSRRSGVWCRTLGRMGVCGGYRIEVLSYPTQ